MIIQVEGGLNVKKLLFIMLLAVVFAGCAAPAPTPTPTPTATPPPTATPTAVPTATPTPQFTPSVTLVTIDKETFMPSTVTIFAGDSVKWRNFGSMPVTIKAEDGSWNSTQIAYNQEFSRVFPTPGTFNYTAAGLGATKGTVIVKPR